MSIPTNQIIQGNALEVLPTLPEGMVDMIFTSPPYWALRAYAGAEPQIWDARPGCRHRWQEIKVGPMRGKETGDWVRPSRRENPGKGERSSSFCSRCGAWRGSLGLEPRIGLYIQHLTAIFEAAKRVLADYGSLWVNISDTFYGSGDHHVNRQRCQGKQFLKRNAEETEVLPLERPTQNGELPAKCLSAIPERLIISLIEHGWIYRNRLVWWKPNVLPESVADRFTIDYELLLFFTKRPRYYFKRQFEPGQQSTLKRYQATLLPIVGGNKYTETPEGVLGASRFSGQQVQPYADRTVRSVWSISSAPRSDKIHFATFPPKLLKRPIDACCPTRVCLKCGKPVLPMWETVTHAVHIPKTRPEPQGDFLTAGAGQKVGGWDMKERPCLKEHRLKGWKACDCNAGFRRGLVLDPFMGSGTTALVARKMGRDYLGIELVPAYIELAKRLLDSDQQELELE